MTMSYTNSRFGRAAVGMPSTNVAGNTSGFTVSGGITGGVSAGNGTAPTAITILAAVGFLVVFYWATRSIQGSR